MNGETADESLLRALERRLACYFSANALALAKLASNTWLQICVFSGHPSVRIGSLVNPSWDGKTYMVRSSRLGASEVSFNALPMFGDDTKVLSSPRGVKLLSNTLAIECIRRNDPDRLNTLDVALLEEVVGQEVNAFHYAAALGNVDCLAVLIRKLGVASPLLAGPDGKLSSEVLCCCDARFPFGDREGLLDLLLHHFGSFGSDALQSLLKSASHYGAPWLMSFVFSRMAESEKDGVVECLRIASENGHTDCARLLLEHGADVNAKHHFGKSVLLWASEKGHTECVRLLLEHGADANAEDCTGETALMAASENGHTDCARLLLEHGADANAEDEDGDSALFWALENKHADCARLLLQHGAEED